MTCAECRRGFHAPEIFILESQNIACLPHDFHLTQETKQLSVQHRKKGETQNVKLHSRFSQSGSLWRMTRWLWSRHCCGHEDDAWWWITRRRTVVILSSLQSGSGHGELEGGRNHFRILLWSIWIRNMFLLKPIGWSSGEYQVKFRISNKVR